MNQVYNVSYVTTYNNVFTGTLRNVIYFIDT
jgi:hypothetical protein